MPADTVVFGEILLRLSAPGRELMLQSGRLDVHVGGAEANVAVALAGLLGAQVDGVAWRTVAACFLTRAVRASASMASSRLASTKRPPVISGR